MIDLFELKHEISGVVILDEVDSLADTFKVDVLYGFLVKEKTAYDFIDNLIIPKIPSKVHFFCWEVVHNFFYIEKKLYLLDP